MSGNKNTNVLDAAARYSTWVVAHNLLSVSYNNTLWGE